MHVIDREKPEGVIVQFGGQTAINLAAPLAKRGVKILGSVVLGDGAYMGEDCIVESSILWSNVRLGSKVTLRECLVANDSLLENNVNAEKTVLGDHVTVSRYSKLGAGTLIWPTAPANPTTPGKL